MKTRGIGWSVWIANIFIVVGCGAPPDVHNNTAGTGADPSASSLSVPAPSGAAGPALGVHGPFEITTNDLRRVSPKPKFIPPRLSQASRKPIAKTPPTFAVTSDPVTSWEAYGANWATGAAYGGLSLGGQAADAQLSVSTTHVIVTARDSIAFYTKSGLKVFGVAEGKSFFTSNGIPDLGPSWGIFDMRTVYDSYRDRFFISGLYQGDDGSGNTGSELVIAISKSTDPTAGFWTYYFDDPFHGATGWQAGDTADYDALGVGPTVYLATANWNSSSGSKGAQAMMFDANAMANGQANPWWWIFWNWTDANGANLYVIQPAVHHGSTGSANTVWFAEKSGNSAQLFHVDNPMQANQAAFLWNTSLTGTSPSGLVDGPQAGVTNPSPPPLGMGAQIGDAFLKAAWRNNKVYLSANSTMNSNGTNLSAGRVIRIDVTTAFGTTEIDRTFGIASAGDPAGSTFYYGWPGVEANANGDMAIITTRTNSSIFPELRISQWLSSDSDIESSALLKSGEAPYHEGSVCLPGVPGWTWECWGEQTGESVDPSDDTGIWVTQQYPVPVPPGFDSNYANYSMWVGKVFGSGCGGHGVCATGGPMPGGCDSFCVDPVCAQDPYCCDTAWDSICVSEVPTYCGGNTCDTSP